MVGTTSIGEDVFSVIAGYIYDPDSIYSLLQAVPREHPFFLPSIKRLFQLPLHLEQVATHTGRVLCILLADTKIDLPVQVVDLIRHIVIPPDTRKSARTHYNHFVGEQIVKLFERTGSLHRVDWYEPTGSCTDNHLKALAKIPTLDQFLLACDPHGGGFGNIEGDRLDYDPAELSRSVGPKLRSLTLELINSELYRALVDLKPVFSSYCSLRSLSLDVTAGVWDWNGSGSPQEGATNDFVFEDLGFPSVVEFGLRVSDLTLSGTKPGPLSLVQSARVENLALDVHPCFSWVSIRNIKVFEGLRPSDYASLKRLQIIDSRRDTSSWYWTAEERQAHDHEYQELGRTYWGLVPNFLSSIHAGNFQHLTQLWVDQDVLSMPKTQSSSSWDGGEIEIYTLAQIQEASDNWDEDERKARWIAVLKAVFSQLESLRVGFGSMDEKEVGIVLGWCSPEKLVQFGFEWKWQLSRRNDPIPSSLLQLFKPFKKLKDLHILHPHPDTRFVFRSPLLGDNEKTIRDIEAIFESHPSICRVGWGRVTVWERNCTHPSWNKPGTSNQVTQVLSITNPERKHELDHIPEFFSTLPVDLLEGYQERRESRLSSADEEIKELRQLLERILPTACAGVAD